MQLSSLKPGTFVNDYQVRFGTKPQRPCSRVNFCQLQFAHAQRLAFQEIGRQVRAPMFITGAVILEVCFASIPCALWHCAVIW